MPTDAHSEFSHIRPDGSSTMVDVGGKPVTARTAEARAVLHTTPEVVRRAFSGDLPKGEALATARAAAVLAAKQTDRLIPFCHGLPLSYVGVEFEAGDDRIVITTEARTAARTGVEMEALVAASVAALTLYDMIKAVDRHAVIEETRAIAKSGGKSGDWRLADA